jgi:hypothetical protein
LSPEELSSYQFLEEQDPLCSIATEPQIPPSLISNDTQLLSNHHQGTSEELFLGSDGHDTGPDHQMFDSEQIVNGTQVDVKYKKSDEPTYVELQVCEPSEAEKHLEEEWAASMAKITPTTADEEQVLVSDGHCTEPENQMLDNRETINGSQLDVTNKNSIELTCTDYQVGEPSEAERNIEELAPSYSKANPIAADVIVETFPLQPVTKTTDSLDGSLGEARDVHNPSGQKEIGKLELEPGNGSFLFDGMNSTKNSDLLDDKAVENLSGLLFEGNSGSVDTEVVEEDHPEPSLESSDCSIHVEGTKHNNQSIEDLEDKVSSNDVGTPNILEKSQKPTGAKVSLWFNHVHVHGCMHVKTFRILRFCQAILLVNETRTADFFFLGFILTIYMKYKWGKKYNH